MRGLGTVFVLVDFLCGCFGMTCFFPRVSAGGGGTGGREIGTAWSLVEAIGTWDVDGASSGFGAAMGLVLGLAAGVGLATLGVVWVMACCASYAATSSGISISRLE